MAVNIIVEDGTGLANANAYATVEAVKQYADERGITLPTDDDAIARLIIRSTDYVDSFECSFCGERLVPTQALAFPRTEPDGMPRQLLALTANMLDALNQGFDPWAPGDNTGLITEETVGPITTRYADPTAFGQSTGIRLQAVQTYLDQLAALCGDCCSGGGMFKTVRV